MIIFVWIIHNLNLIIRKIHLRDILQNNWPVIFKFQGHEREGRKNRHRLEETEAIWQVNSMWDLGLDPETE